MSGSWSQKRKDGKIIFRIRGCEHIEVISEIVTSPVRIPTDVAIRLMVNPVAFAVTDSLFQAITSVGFPLASPSVNRNPITGDCEVFQIDQALINIYIQKPGLKNRKETPGWSKVLGRFDLKSIQQVRNRQLVNRIRFLPFFLGFSLDGRTERERFFFSTSKDA